MIISLRQVSRFIRMIIFVVAFSFICFKLLGIVQDMIQPANKYKEPIGGDALKVNGAIHAGAQVVSPDTLWNEMLARLALFLQNWRIDLNITFVQWQEFELCLTKFKNKGCNMGKGVC